MFSRITHLNTLFWDVEVVGHKQSFIFIFTIFSQAVLDVQSFRSNLDQMVVIQFPYLKSTMLCSKLSKGIGHNYYGEPAWPNDILYIFPIVICGIILQLLGLAIHQPYNKSEHANPFATPLEILPEWYLLTTFNLLRILSSKLKTKCNYLFDLVKYWSTWSYY